MKTANGSLTGKLRYTLDASQEIEMFGSCIQHGGQREYGRRLNRGTARNPRRSSLTTLVID
jgi:hypothetical protein